MKFTIITVCLNAASTIAGVIKSVKDQSYHNYEHIILDGGSSDGTVEQIKQLAHPMLLLISEPDDGIYDAMNKGIRRATGDVLIFLNADDELAGPDVLRIISDVFKKQPNLKLAYGDVQGISQDCVKLIEQPRKPDRRTLARTTICHQALFTHRDLFRDIGEYQVQFPVVADWDWLYQAIIIQKEKIQFIPIVVARIGMEGVSHTVDFWTEKQRALRQYYSDFEIWQYRKLPIWWKQKKQSIKGLARRRRDRILRGLKRNANRATTWACEADKSID